MLSDISRPLCSTFFWRRKMLNIYDNNGYLNIENILKTKLTFLFVVGGRGIGKTFGALKYVVEHNIKFVFLRRTQSQVDLINKQEFSPMTPIANYLHMDIVSVPLSKYNVGFYKAVTNDEGKLSPVGECLGYSMALSTVSNLRGFSADDVQLIIFDEFIPERHERPIKEEAAALFNCYETINRNRELDGRPPVQLLCLANSNDAGNPIFTELKLISKVENMKKKGQVYSLDYNRCIGIFMPDNSSISRAKKETALYKLTSGSDFEQMALANEFDDFRWQDNIRSMPLKELKPLCSVGELCFYKHKSQNIYYCTTAMMSAPDEYHATDKDLKRFRRKHGYLWLAYLRNLMLFEDATSEIIFNKYMNM